MKQFRDALGRLGIERVESVGHPFDPSIHEAIQHLETEQFQPGCVAAEVQPGYRAAERLIRPALVVVAKAPTKSDEVTTTETSAGESQEDTPPQSAGGESKGA
jgi:molecular chaperone GrpE